MTPREYTQLIERVVTSPRVTAEEAYNVRDAIMRHLAQIIKQPDATPTLVGELTTQLLIDAGRQLERELQRAPVVFAPDDPDNIPLLEALRLDTDVLSNTMRYYNEFAANLPEVLRIGLINRVTAYVARAFQTTDQQLATMVASRSLILAYRLGRADERKLADG